MFRRMVLAGVLGFVALAGLATPAAADVTLTVVTKGGQRHSGHNLWYRVDRREVVVRTSQAEEPRIPVDQVAFIDFGGTAEVDPRISGSQEALVLRNGTTLKGQVLELGHTNRADENSEYLVSFKTESGEERRFQAKEVSRVYFAGYSPSSSNPTSTPTTGSTSAQGITVSGQQPWTPTGVIVRRGDTVTFNATGEIRIGGPGNPTANPAGVSPQTTAPGAPLDNAPAGALIGRVGNGRPFLIGNQERVRMTEAGQLFVGINDGHLEDNEGAFQVSLQIQTGRIR
jgi:hypothetical protein